MEKYQLIYKIDKNKSSIRLLGEIFFRRNRTSGYFIINNRSIPLSEKLDTKNIKKGELKVYLIFHNINNNKSHMFEDCKDLLYFYEYKPEINHNFPSIINYYETEEDNLFNLYDKCGISENTLLQNIEDIENIEKTDSFQKYSDISKKYQKSSIYQTIQKFYNFLESIKNYTYSFANMFYNCYSLLEIFDISKWDTSNVSNMSGMFANCIRLNGIHLM